MGKVQSLLMLKQVVHIGTAAFAIIKFMLFILPVCPYVCHCTAESQPDMNFLAVPARCNYFLKSKYDQYDLNLRL
jgi:hypothetical protein